MIVAIIIFFVLRDSGQKDIGNQNQSTSIVAPVVSSNNQASSTDNIKIYRNTEWGFEFQYPEDWSFHANTFGSPFSKFNLVGASPEENGHPNPILPSIVINIATPDFAERAILSIQNLGATTSSLFVDGVRVTQYVYSFEGGASMDVIVPHGSATFIFGAIPGYKTVFNQILATFKFLK